MKNKLIITLLSIFLITSILLINSCDKEKNIKTYQINEEFSLKYDEYAYVIDTTNNKKYKVKFEPNIQDNRPDKYQCITILYPPGLTIKGSITFNNITAYKGFYYQACNSSSNIGNPNNLFRLDTFGVSLKMHQAFPSEYENTKPSNEEYSAKFILKKL